CIWSGRTELECRCRDSLWPRIQAVAPICAGPCSIISSRIPQRTQSLFRSVRNDFHAELPPARAVELAKENALPAAQAEPAILDENRLRDTREWGLDVGIGVSFGVTVRCVARRQPVKRRFEVPRNVGVIVFIDDQSGGGLWH